MPTGAFNGETRPAAVPSTATYDNAGWADCAPQLSIVIPFYRYDLTGLLNALGKSPAINQVEVIAYDDGSQDPKLLSAVHSVARELATATRVVSCSANRGRSAARNAAVAHARADWILLLDADMLPDSPEFIETYVAAVREFDAPCVIVGGYTLRLAPTSPRFALHRWQAERSECVGADRRRRFPGRYVFSCNVLVHRQVLDTFPFDEEYSGWGAEDTDWGLRVEECFPIIHIDNSFSHLGLDDDTGLMSKYAGSGPNFARLAVRHPTLLRTMPLFRAARVLRHTPMRTALKGLARAVAASHLMPLGVRGRALKVWRALIVAEAL